MIVFFVTSVGLRVVKFNNYLLQVNIKVLISVLKVSKVNNKDSRVTSVSVN